MTGSWEGSGLICVVNVLNKDGCWPHGCSETWCTSSLSCCLSLSADAHGQDTGKGHGVAKSMSTAGAGGALVAPLRRCWCRFWPMKGLPVTPSSVRGGFSPLSAVLVNWGQTHPLASRAKPGASHRPLWGLMLGCFRLFLEQGPSVRATTASPGQRRWELPHFAAAPTCFEQEEQTWQLPAAREVSRITTHSPVEGDGAQGWGSGKVEGGCVPRLSRSLPWGLGCALGGATVELWELWELQLSTKPRRFLASALFSSWTRFLLHAVVEKYVPLHKMPFLQHQFRENYSLQLHWRHRRTWQIKPELTGETSKL